MAGWDPQPAWRFGVGAFNSESDPYSVFVGIDEYSVHGLTVARLSNPNPKPTLTLTLAQALLLPLTLPLTPILTQL